MEVFWLPKREKCLEGIRRPVPLWVLLSRILSYMYKAICVKLYTSHMYSVYNNVDCFINIPEHYIYTMYIMYIKYAYKVLCVYIVYLYITT